MNIEPKLLNYSWVFKSHTDRTLVAGRGFQAVRAVSKVAKQVLRRRGFPQKERFSVLGPS